MNSAKRRYFKYLPEAFPEALKKVFFTAANKSPRGLRFESQRRGQAFLFVIVLDECV